MNGFSDNIMFSPNMRDRDNNIIFNTFIRYDEHGVRTIGGALVDILKFVEIGSSCFGIFIFYYIKGKIIRKSVY